MFGGSFSHVKIMLLLNCCSTSCIYELKKIDQIINLNDYIKYESFCFYVPRRPLRSLATPGINCLYCKIRAVFACSLNMLIAVYTAHVT